MRLPVRYLATTLALLAIGGALAVMRGSERAPWVRPGPAERRPAVRVVRPPTVRWTAREVLGRGEALGLDPAQRARLEGLDREWQRENGPLEAEVQAAVEAFAAFARQAQGPGRASLAEVAGRGAEVGRLGGPLRERRRAHAEAVVEVLTEPQRARLAVLAAGAMEEGRR